MTRFAKTSARTSHQGLLYKAALVALTLATAFYLGSPHVSTRNASLAQFGSQAHAVAFRVDASSPGSHDWTSATGLTAQSSHGSNSATLLSTEWDPYSRDTAIAPITDVTLVSCAFPPSIWSDACLPPSTPAETAVRGPWIRVDKDLNRHGIGLWYLYLYYRRQQTTSVGTAIDAIQLLSPDEAKASTMSYELASGGWRMVEQSLHSGIWRSGTLNLWYKTAAGTNAFTELDVVYGKSALRPGWEDLGVISETKGKGTVRLQGRRQDAPPVPPRSELRFSSSGDFKILQIADLHFSVGEGLCRDIVNATACSPIPEAGDAATLAWLRPLIAEVQPNLIILTGDQLNGQESSWAAASVINTLAAFFTAVAVPWAVTFGNHDSEETDLDRAAQMQIYEALPYFVGSAGPPTVDGVGNYRLPLMAADPTNTTLFNLYFLDSHANYKSFWSASEYDWIKDSQTSWFRSESGKVQPILRPYSPPDLSYEKGPFGISGSQSDDSEYRQSADDYKRQSAERLLKPNAMAVWHIPVPEAYDAPDRSPSGQPLEVGSTHLEGNSAPKKNSGFFADGLLMQREAEMGYDSPPEVKATIHGHSHLRDACSRIRGVWMCFSGGSSYSGYGLLGFDRRVRVFELSDYGERIATYKLLDGSGAGARADGTYASASAAAEQAASTTVPDETDNRPAEVSAIPEEPGQYGEEVDELVNELKAEEAALQSSNPDEAAALGELAEELEEEEAIGEFEDEELRPRQVSSRYAVLDYMVLAGRDAMV